MPWIVAPYALLAFGLVLGNLGARRIMPPSLMVLGLLVLVVAALALLLSRRSYVAATLVLALGHLGIAIVGSAWFPASHMALTALIPVIVAGIILGVVGGLLLAALTTVVLVVGYSVGSAAITAPLHLVILIGTTWCVAYFMAISQRPAQTMVAWAWQGYDQARRHLAAARRRQVELKQALEDLDLANREVLRLNDLLSAAREALEEARRAKEFAANVSHELRTPLNMIIGFSNEIVQRPDLYAETLPAELIEDIITINRNSQHLAHLVDDVLDLVEAESGFTRLTREWSAIDEVVRQATDAMAAFFEKKRLRLDVRIPANLPPVYCDRARIGQVILNLLSNAARFTESGGATIVVGQQESVVTIEVTDTGEGIGPDSLRHLFEPFQQADPSLRRRHVEARGSSQPSPNVLWNSGGQDIDREPVECWNERLLQPAAEDGTEATSPKRWFGHTSAMTRAHGPRWHMSDSPRRAVRE